MNPLSNNSKNTCRFKAKLVTKPIRRCELSYLKTFVVLCTLCLCFYMKTLDCVKAKDIRCVINFKNKCSTYKTITNLNENDEIELI